jgi:hypothetical protein
MKRKDLATWSYFCREVTKQSSNAGKLAITMSCEFWSGVLRRECEKRGNPENDHAMQERDGESFDSFASETDKFKWIVI